MKNNHLSKNSLADPPAWYLAPLLWIAVAALLFVVALNGNRLLAEAAPRQQSGAVSVLPVAPYAGVGEISVLREGVVFTPPSYLVADHVQAF